MRHDQIHSKVQFGAAAAGHSSSIEPHERHLKNLAFGDPGYGKRGDFAVSTVDDLLNIDVTVVHPASSSMRSRASREPGITAREAEKKKRRDHGVGAVGHTFVPFAIETYGRLGVEAVKLLKDWAKTAGEADMMDRNSYLVWMKREISVSLIKGNARMFRRFVGLLTRGVGQRYLSGDSHLNID